MFRGDFLKALAGFGFVAAIPKEEDNPVITSEDGRTAWDSEGQVWSEAGDMYVEDYNKICVYDGTVWHYYRSGITTGVITSWE